MSASAKPRYAIVSGWNEKEGGWGQFVNQNFCKIDNLLFPAVESVGTPPIGDFPGVQYIDADGNLQTFVDGAYVSCAPKTGMLVWDRSSKCLLVYDETEWVDFVAAKSGGGAAPIDPADILIGELGGINIAGITDGQTICWDNGAQSFAAVDKAVGGLPDDANINDLAGIDTTGATEGQTLCFDAQGVLVPVDKPEDSASDKPVNSFLSKTMTGSFPVGTQVFVDATGALVRADATDVTMNSQFTVVADLGTEVCIQGSGFVEIPGHGYTIGQYYFVDEANPGDPTINLPTPGNFEMSAFYVLDANCLQILSSHRSEEA